MIITYDKIKPLIKKTDVDGIQVKFDFQTDEMAQPIQGFSAIMADQKEIVSQTVKSTAKVTVVTMIVSFFSRMLGRSVGGAAGSVISSTATAAAATAVTAKMTPSADEMLKTDVTPEKLEKAAVEAFKNVLNFFEYNEAENK